MRVEILALAPAAYAMAPCESLIWPSIIDKRNACVEYITVVRGGHSSSCSILDQTLDYKRSFGLVLGYERVFHEFFSRCIVFCGCLWIFQYGDIVRWCHQHALDNGVGIQH